MAQFKMINFVFITCFILGSIQAAPTIDNSVNVEIPYRYDGAQLWRVTVDNDAAKELVFELQRKFEIELWDTNGVTVDIFMTKSAIDGGIANVLNKANIPYSVINENIQETIDNENLSQEEIEISRTGKPHQMTWTAYHRLDDIYNFIEYLAKTHPELCTVITIGKSLEDRRLKVLKVSNKNSKNKAIWVDGGIHAREWVSPASVTYFLNDLVLNWDKQPDHVKNINWFIQPVVNPDGYEYSHTTRRLWRKNRRNSTNGCQGVDLNRNYGYKWGGQGASTNPCSEIYRGAAAFSEPETAAQQNFFKNTKEIFYGFFTFHSYGQYLLYPWGFDTSIPPDHADLKRLGDVASENLRKLDGQIYRAGSSGSLISPAAGASDDYGKSIGIKYSYTIELRDRGRYGFVLPAGLIVATALEAREFLHTAAQTIAQIQN